MKQIWFLNDIDLFHILCPYKFVQHVKHHPPTTYHKQEFLFLPNEITQDIYLITSGKIKVGYYDDEGQEHIKAYLSQGEILGEMAFLGHCKNQDFAQVVQEGTQVCRMSVERARELAREYVPFGLEIHKRIGDNIRKLERRLEILFFKDIKRRLLELLRDLTQAFGAAPAEDGSVAVNHGLTQQELASLIGTSRKTVSLQLNDWEREGYLTQGKGKFCVMETLFLEFLSQSA